MSQPAPAAVGHLRVDGIEKRFDAIDVLGGVSVDVPAGSMCALLGPSGSGKTTLLRVIAGIELADAGSIGMVFQDWALFPHLTVSQNVAFGLDRSDASKRRVDEVLEMVCLDGFGDRSPGDPVSIEYRGPATMAYEPAI
ncbi:MAG: ATP-binding cassette domain-containing protein [Ilumatobacteraceae bacterium]